MFKTSQPNPEGSKKDSVEKKRNPEAEFETLVDFSNWLDEQLFELESNHEQFFTSVSVRNFFKRN